MQETDYLKLREEVEGAVVSGVSAIALLGLTSATLRLLSDLALSGASSAIVAVITDSTAAAHAPTLRVPVRSFETLQDTRVEVVAVMADQEKESLLLSALPFLANQCPRLILGGFGHYDFRDPVFQRLKGDLLVPSLANGYPHTLTHLYQCLLNCARLDLKGVVAEFGMFKGGTTMFLSRVVEHLGRDWPVLGFDTFGGFPPPRSPLDMYAHPDCVFSDVAHVRSYLADRRVEIIVGDVVLTSNRLASEDVILTFMDTDNFTSANAALDIVQERTVVGGAIVFDHFTGTNRFLYTLGERMAGARLLNDTRYFHLHGTGVFYRQR